VFLATRRPVPARRPAGRDICPHTGRARLGYDRARVLLKQYTATGGSGGLELHQLRHSAATHLGDQKVPLQLIMAKTRHKSPRTVVVVVGRGRVIAGTSVADLIAAASGNRITLRTSAPADAMTVLANAGAEVTATGSGVLTMAGLTSETTISVLTSNSIPFSEVTTHRATLEEAYMELTRESVEYRAEVPS
jgi:hypothetical protein